MEHACARVSFSIKLQAQRPATLLKKETLAHLFSCEICKNFQNIFFQNTLNDCVWIFQLTSSYLEAYLESICAYWSLCGTCYKCLFEFIKPLLILISGHNSFFVCRISSRFTSVLFNPFHATEFVLCVNKLISTTVNIKIATLL